SAVGHAALLNYLSLAIEHTKSVPPVAKIQPDRDLPATPNRCPFHKALSLSMRPTAHRLSLPSHLILLGRFIGIVISLLCHRSLERIERTNRDVISVRITEGELPGLSVRVHVLLFFKP